MLPAANVNVSLSYLCDAREKRFLYDLMQEDPDVMGDHPIPELRALLSALERMWGGADAKQLTVPSELMYYLVVYATYAHHIPEDVAEWRTGAAHDVYVILQGFIQSVALAIKDGAVVRHEDGETARYPSIFSAYPSGFTMR